MADLARLSGVSVSTVSRALSGSSLVNQKTRERIEELARSLNYSINIGAQNLRRGQQNRTVAVIVPYQSAARQRITDPFMQSMLGSLADVLTERGYDMLLSRVDADRLDLAAQFYESRRAVGIILIGQWHQHDQLNRLAARRVPLVVWGAQLTQQIYSCVGGDNRAGGRLATEHLLAQGLRRIAFIGNAELPEVAHRFEGYQEAHMARAVRPLAELYKPVPFLAESARACVEDLLAKKIKFDAIFASSDQLAIAAIGALNEHGLRVPDDIPVVGYDDIEIASHFHPSLTTISQPIQIAAQALVDTLFSCLSGKSPPPVVLPAELLIRDSSKHRRSRK